MIAIFITIFIAVIVGVSLIGPISDQVSVATNATGNGITNLSLTSSWGSTVLKLVPGFFALVILGVVVAGLYTVFRQAGIV